MPVGIRAGLRAALRAAEAAVPSSSARASTPARMPTAPPYGSAGGGSGDVQPVHRGRYRAARCWQAAALRRRWRLQISALRMASCPGRRAEKCRRSHLHPRVPAMRANRLHLSQLKLKVPATLVFRAFSKPSCTVCTEPCRGDDGCTAAGRQRIAKVSGAIGREAAKIKLARVVAHQDRATVMSWLAHRRHQEPAAGRD